MGRPEPLPLSAFPLAHQERIREAVAAPTPPPKWITHKTDGKPMFQTVSRAWYEWHWQRGLDPHRIRAKTPQATRQQVLARDGYVCQLCGGAVEPDDVHIDHIHPHSLGGGNEVSNLQVSHSRCNMRKGAKAE